MTDMSAAITRWVEKAMSRPDGSSRRRFIEREVPQDVRHRVHAEMMKRARLDR